MEEALKSILSSAGVCGGLLIYYLVQIKPELRAYQKSQAEEAEKIRIALKEENDLLREKMERMINALNIFSRVQALRVASSHDVHPELRESAEQIIHEIDEQSKK